jgi:hypothetical protein
VIVIDASTTDGAQLPTTNSGVGCVCELIRTRSAGVAQLTRLELKRVGANGVRLCEGIDRHRAKACVVHEQRRTT